MQRVLINPLFKLKKKIQLHNMWTLWVPTYMEMRHLAHVHVSKTDTM